MAELAGGLREHAMTSTFRILATAMAASISLPLWQFQPVQKGENSVIRRVDVVDGKVPIHGVVEFRLADSSR